MNAKFDSAVREFKQALMAAATDALSKLQTETGVVPSRVELVMQHVTTHGDVQFVKHALSGIRVEFRL